MTIKNLMMEIISNTVSEVLSDNENLLLNETNRDDIIAYVLNRVPPKYITSERGILHGKIEEIYKFQERADILFLTHEAINIILHRRESEIINKNDEDDSKNILFPHIIGQVLEETTLSVIPNIYVYLMYGDIPAQMMDSDWKNPYKTNSSTKGYFHFWPEFNEKTMDSESAVPFNLVFSHPDFQEKTESIELEVLNKSEIGKTRILPIVLVSAKNGVNLDIDDKD